MKRIVSECFKNTTISPCLTYHKHHYELNQGGEIVGVVDDFDQLYKDLERRLDLSILPYPRTEYFDKMIRWIFRPEDIPLITHIRMGPTPVSEIAEKLGFSHEYCHKLCKELTLRGIVSCFEVNGHEFVVLPEFVLGLWEFTFVYLSEQLGGQEEFEKYFGDDFDFGEFNGMMDSYFKMYSNTFFQFDDATSIFRVAPFDLKNKKNQEVLTYETVVSIVENARIISVVPCPCKVHETAASGIPLPDNIPLECCYQYSEAAEAIIKCGIGKEVSLEDCLKELEHLKDTGHMFNAENNKGSGYFCSCHKDWCGVRKIFEHCGSYLSHRSPFIPVFNTDDCVGCGECVERCPVSVLELVSTKESHDKKKPRNKVKMIEGGYNICVGCLNCYWGCKVEGAITQERRPEREIYDIPEDIFEFGVRRAYERGRMHTMMFDDPQSKLHGLLRSVFNLIENNFLMNVLKKNEKLSNKFIKFVSKKGSDDFLKSVGFKD